MKKTGNIILATAILLMVIFITTPVWILPYKVIRGALERRANYSYAKEVAEMGKYAVAGFKAGLESVGKPNDQNK